ncbi:phage tail tape measure protein [Streptomyces sp. CB01201]|uniref:phage tail tape measure protein n=1 Tax=Streptomyces sp. CB01201 TaxID=2020324 RepID=UPI001F164927|nr:phage tail tape measure protein [Streptomyces sp. CB01201]
MMGKAALLGLGVAAGAAAVATVKMAGDFQVQMTRVRTGAGEAASNMKMVGDGILAMAGEVGQSTSQLTAGLYMVESAGYHGADALKVLKVSAEGAKVGAADLHTTTDAVTTAMNAYKMSSGDATTAMNALIATEAEGKTNLEALAGSMSSILPVAAAAGVRLNEVMGAMATMTAQGTPAAVAATYLRQTIGQLSNVLPKAATTMKGLGLNAIDVEKELGSQGLAATLTTLTDAIKNKMGPSGTVLIDTLQKASANSKDFQGQLNKLSGSQKTYIGALATMVGGTKSMMGALQLTGSHMETFKANIAGVDEHVKAGGKSIEGWADVQKNFNQKVAEGKASMEALGIQIGQVLMPYVQQIIGVLATSASWIAKHSMAAKVAAGIIGGVLVFSIAALTASLYSMAAAAAVNPVTWIILGVVALVAAIVALATHWSTVWGAIKSVAESVGHFLASVWQSIASVATSVWHSISGTVMGVWNAIAGFLSAAWHTVVDPLVAGWNFLWGITQTVWNAIAGFFRKWWPLLFVIFMPFVAAIVAIWNHFHTQIIGTAISVWNAISAFFGSVWNGIKTVASAVWSIIHAVIIDPITEVWTDVKIIWTALGIYLSQKWAAIKAVASVLWNAIKSSMITPIQGALSTIMSVVSRIASAISSGLRSAWNAVKGVGSWFLSIGSSIVHGIINGVENAAGGLFDSLKNLAGDALSSAKSFLGINSPSRLFADHVGVAIPEGIAKGITDNAHLAVRSVISMSDTLASQQVGVPSLAMAGAGVGAGGGFGAGAPGGTVTVHLHVQGSILTDKDLQDELQRQFLQRGSIQAQTYQPFRR